MFHQQRPANIFLLVVVTGLLMMGSCTVVKNYPANTPFVFENIIHVNGDISKDETKRLENELSGYWDDSIAVRTITQFGVRSVIKEPKVFDSSDINPSMMFMRSYLNAQGYYNVELADTVYFDTLRDQVRTTVQMDIAVGRSLHLDSIAYDLNDTALNRLVAENKKGTFLKTGDPYSKQNIASELDRLVNVFRTNGFFKLTRDFLVAELDTTDRMLLEITLDPFEQAQNIAEAARRRRENPTVNILIRQRNLNDTTEVNYLTKYYNGNLYYYPETRINDIPDSLMTKNYRINFSKNDATLRQNEAFIHFNPLYEHTYLRKGLLFNQDRYYKTLNNLNQLGAWNQVDVRTVERMDSVPVIDYHFFLTPAQKYSLSTELEVSRNSGTILNGNLLGIANNVTFRNRNAWKESVQTSTVIRNGIELSFTDSIPLQTFQSSISHAISIPKFIVPFKIDRIKRLDAYRTVINLSAAYTERRKFFRLRSILASWGYEWKNNNHSIAYRPLNVEVYSLDTLEGLTSAFIKNPFLRTAFNTGNVVSQTFSYTVTFPGTKSPNVSNYIRFSAEEAGAILGRFKGLNDKIYQYIKAESEFRQLRQLRKTELAYRLFGGIGYNYSNDPVIGQSLPFFKQFVAGGPNSMRAWPLRQLGLGSSLVSDTSTSFRDRYGDIQLEANVEYRFPLATISTVKIASALFVDAGNIWNLKNAEVNPLSKLSWNRFYRDIAIGAGTGLRLDFSYFLIRLDFAYKVKDPARRNNRNGWMSIKDFEWRNKEFTNIGPNAEPLVRNNYAFQLGIGLPF